MELVVVIFPYPQDSRHCAVQTLLLAEAGVPSQIINCETISDKDKLRSVTQEIFLKINCKMGGELWAVNIPSKTMMVCGIDFYHDPTGRGQSVVGFVTSVNPAITRWYSQAKFHSPGSELVDILKGCLMESLKKYHEVIITVLCYRMRRTITKILQFLFFLLCLGESRLSRKDRRLPH